MVGIKETVWAITPHTAAKHQILEEYLKAWLPILSKWNKRLVYLDGFAGPGVYEGGEIGSPIIAIKTALSHRLAQRFGEVVFFFIEQDKDRAARLSEVIKSYFPHLPKNIKYEVRSSEFAPTLESMLSDLEKEGAELAPTFAFLDPFGFSGFPMKTIARILNYEKCEVLITFMVKYLERFSTQQPEPVDELYLTKDWHSILDVPNAQERERAWITLYETQFKKHGAKFVRSFRMIGQDNRTIYYLVYATKNIVGMRVMKEAMTKVDGRGTYSFSDTTDPHQTFLIHYSNESTWIPAASEQVLKKFCGQTTAVEEVESFVILETRFPFRKAILEHVERSGSIVEVFGRKKKFTYPDGCQIRFVDDC